MTSLLALARKNLLVTLRAPLFAIISIAVPVAFTMLYAIVVQVSTTAPIAVAMEDTSPLGTALVETMRDLHNDDGPYYEIRETDPARARQMYADGEVGALLTVPVGFGADVAAGRPVSVRLDLVNINADGTKNQHLRLEETLRRFELANGARTAGKLAISETKVLAHDIPITVYLGTALMVFAALYSGIVGAGTTVAREFEDRTAKALLTSPSGSAVLLGGTCASVAITSLVTVTVGVAGVGWVLGYPLGRLGLLTAAGLVITWAYGAALGVLLGVVLRRSLPLVPIAVIIAVFHFLVSGYESYLRGFAHGGLVEPLWRSTGWIPLAGVVDAARFEVAGLAQPAGTAAAFIWTAAAAVFLAAAAAVRLTRTLRFAQGQ
jgi:ABC-type multidrug transport system permease subunit